MRLEESLDQLQRTAIVPMQFVPPVPCLFFQQGIQLARSCLPKVDYVHGRMGRNPGLCTFRRERSILSDLPTPDTPAHVANVANVANVATFPRFGTSFF